MVLGVYILIKNPSIVIITPRVITKVIMGIVASTIDTIVSSIRHSFIVAALIEVTSHCVAIFVFSGVIVGNGIVVTTTGGGAGANGSDGFAVITGATVGIAGAGAGAG